MSSILKIDWATHESAKYACENWHYSKTLPPNKTVKIGAWENEKFIGVVVFGCGTSATSHLQFGIKQTEICELVRIALTKHIAPVSKIMALAIRFLKTTNQKLKICVSFADPDQGHHGGIYQATNWIYTGKTASQFQYFINGKWTHATRAHKNLGKKLNLVPKKKVQPKHKYVIALTSEMRQRILPLARPYPKRAGSIVVDAPAIHAGEGGAEPTPALHSL